MANLLTEGDNNPTNFVSLVESKAKNLVQNTNGAKGQDFCE
jgi:hypothetical protein